MSATIAHPQNSFDQVNSVPRWPAWLIPSTEDVSFGWEHDPQPSSNYSSPKLEYDSNSNKSPTPHESGETNTGSSTPDLVSSSRSSSTSSRGSTSPTTQAALLIRSHSQGWARCFELHPDWPSPTITAPDEVLVRNVAMGLNPVDWKSLLYRFGIERFPWVLGRDVCGVVEKVAEGVTNVQVGDRIWTCSDSRDVRSGAYQASSVHKAFTLGKLPPQISDDRAATIGTGLVTAAVALYWFFNLERAREVGGGPLRKVEEGAKKDHQDQDGDIVLPSSRRMKRDGFQASPLTHSTASASPIRWLLIFGGGAITGLYSTQLAHLSSTNVKVLCVASPCNFPYLESLGADACVDRFLSPKEILDKVKQITGEKGRVDWALDCVGSETASLCLEILKSSHQSGQEGEQGEGQLICLAGNPKRRRQEDEVEQPEGDVAPRAVTIHRISFSTTYYSSHTFTSQLLSDVEILLSSGSLRTVEPLVLEDGLAGVRKGLEMLRDGECPRTKKLVVRMAETPKDLEVTLLGKKEDVGWNGCV